MVIGNVNNVLLISLDALRYDYFKSVTERSEPVVDRIVSNSIVFKQHITTGPGTSTAFPGIHASALPLDYGYRGISQQHRTISEQLQAAGITTGGITAQTSCSSAFGYDSGFNTFIDWTQRGKQSALPSVNFLREKFAQLVRGSRAERPIKKVYSSVRSDEPPYIQANEISDQASDFLPKLSSTDPFFGWIHFMEPHAPYYPPRELINQHHSGNFTTSDVNELVRGLSQPNNSVTVNDLSSSEKEAIKDYYGAQLEFGVKELVELLEVLSEEDILKDTAIIITSDHGEELFDHGGFGHKPKMHEELIHVPLLLYHPDRGSDWVSTLDSVTSHLDLAPTVTDLFGTSAHHDWKGKSLLRSLSSHGGFDRNYAISELCHQSGLGGEVDTSNHVISIRGENWKVIIDKQNSTHRLFRVEDNLCEIEVRIGKNVNRYRSLVNIAQDRSSSIDGEMIQTREVDEGVKEQLRKLGYDE